MFWCHTTLLKEVGLNPKIRDWVLSSRKVLYAA